MKEMEEITLKESWGLVRWMWRLRYQVVTVLYLHFKNEDANHSFNTKMYESKGFANGYNLGWRNARRVYEYYKEKDDENRKESFNHFMTRHIDNGCVLNMYKDHEGINRVSVCWECNEINKL